MYNSRDGFGIMYRYHPREIENLCKDRLLGDIKIHCSVIERLNHRTANYAPGYIPAEFEVVDSEVPSNTIHLDPGKNEHWGETRSLIDKTVLTRKRLYGAMLASIVSVLAAAFYFNNDSQPAEAQNAFLDKVAGFFYSVLPDFFTGLINVVVVQQPYYLLAVLILVILYLKVRRILHMKTVRLCETLRHYIIQAQVHQLSCNNISAIKDDNS
jgi:hypothetical protein